MADQKLIQYILQQLESGVSKDELLNDLRKSGWQETAILDALSSIQSEVRQADQNSLQSEKKYDKWIIIAITTLVLLLIGGGAYAVSQILANQARLNFMQTTEVPVVQIEADSDSQVSLAIDTLDSVGDDSQSVSFQLAKNIESCTPFQIEFVHPFDGQTYVKEIVGFEGDACYYTEEMPNNGKMDCYFNTQQTEAIAQYNRQYAESESLSFSSQVSLSPDGANSQTLEAMDGEEVINPWNTALQDGTCVVSGY